ncbi:unnamed protein product [Heligmosomoides polygyrus]|uniref:MFS domain-containing protein n=1 Tax=Heligmosomoides polygyrus TaxID=6339 RepID=A0A183G8L7_HELPZ|nr:unnamed protein product [Heligmosomoides polygyrus]
MMKIALLNTSVSAGLLAFALEILECKMHHYCLCNACLKLVNYAFFFWLPLYLTEAYHWEEAKADQLSIWYDVGGIIGSVGGGYISDKMRCRAPLIVAMLTGSLFSLFVYARIGPELIWNVLVMTVVGITVSGPYNLIVGTISIDLGSQPILASNAQVFPYAMSTVSGLLDGTGSAGSAVGQLFIPMLQVSLGWESVFYLFILLVGARLILAARPRGAVLFCVVGLCWPRDESSTILERSGDLVYLEAVREGLENAAGDDSRTRSTSG